ncbi:MAG: hypothetical protein KHX08_03120, partial [Clostridiales bacterium]|nr:hypothetical protein [Clostridiales bacterium]
RITGQSLEPGSQVEKQTSLTLTIGTGKHSPSTTAVNVAFNVPENGVVVVTQTDANGGETMLYRGVHQEGEHFSKMYNAPSGSTITASINGKNISQTVAE